MVIDVNMDEGMIDGVAAMTKFLRIAVTEPDVSKVRGVAPNSALHTHVSYLRGLFIAGSIYDRLVQVRGRRGRPEGSPGQVHCQLDQPQGW